MKKVQLLAVFLFASVGAAFAQTTANETVTLALSDVVEVQLTPSAGNAFTFSSVADYEAGITNANASTLKVNSNRNWSMTVKAATVNFTGGDAATPMPADVLKVKKNGAATFLTMSTNDQVVATGSNGNASTSGNTFTVDYRATPGFAYRAGNYSLQVTYTVTQQ